MIGGATTSTVTRSTLDRGEERLELEARHGDHRAPPASGAAERDHEPHDVRRTAPPRARRRPGRTQAAADLARPRCTRLRVRERDGLRQRRSCRSSRAAARCPRDRPAPARAARASSSSATIGVAPSRLAEHHELAHPGAPRRRSARPAASDGTVTSTDAPAVRELGGQLPLGAAGCDPGDRAARGHGAERHARPRRHVGRPQREHVAAARTRGRRARPPRARPAARAAA